MEASEKVSEAQIGSTLPRNVPRSLPNRLMWAMYAVALAASISVWFIAIREPLWLDETVSYFQIKGSLLSRFSLDRDGPTFQCTSASFGYGAGWRERARSCSEFLPSSRCWVRFISCTARRGNCSTVILLSSRRLSSASIQLSFSAAIDVRPYAFGALAITASILALVHLRHNGSNWLAALFGLSAACIVYFQFLFAVILPALVICFLAIKIGDKAFWRQFGVALIAFAVAFLPVIPGLRYMFHTSGIHVFSPAATWGELGQTLATKRMALILAGIVLLAAASRKA